MNKVMVRIMKIFADDNDIGYAAIHTCVFENQVSFWEMAIYVEKQFSFNKLYGRSLT